jgi:hypothetical protein
MSTIPPELQADAILNQAAPVQNTWYTVLDTTENVRVLNILFTVGVPNEDVEVELTIDGRTFVAGQAPATGASIYYFVLADSVLATMDFGFNTELAATVPTWVLRPFLIECRSLRVRIRKTSANGAGILSCGVHYQKW